MLVITHLAPRLAVELLRKYTVRECEVRGLSADCSAEYLGQDWLVLVLVHSHLSCLFLPLPSTVSCYFQSVFLKKYLVTRL